MRATGVSVRCVLLKPGEMKKESRFFVFSFEEIEKRSPVRFDSISCNFNFYFCFCSYLNSSPSPLSLLFLEYITNLQRESSLPCLLLLSRAYIFVGERRVILRSSENGERDRREEGREQKRRAQYGYESAFALEFDSD